MTKTARDHASIARRDRRIWELHAEAMTLEAIADVMLAEGLTPKRWARQQVYRRLAVAIERTENGLNQGQIALLEQSKINTMRAAAWKKALNDKGELVDRQAAELWLKLTERYAKLAGLDKPIKIDLTDELRQIADENGLDADELIAIAVRYTSNPA